MSNDLFYILYRFYPYHYAPFVSDIKGISDLSIQFELGTPFLPFEQLLAVLPASSKTLLPNAYQVKEKERERFREEGRKK